MRPRTRRLETKKTVDLTPMVDVIFLLVIFFMTSSTLIKVRALKIDLPESAASEQQIAKPIVFSINAKGNYYLNGKRIKNNRVEASLKKLASKSKIKLLLVEGYKNLPYNEIVRAMSLAKQSGFERVSLSVKND